MPSIEQEKRLIAAVQCARQTQGSFECALVRAFSSSFLCIFCATAAMQAMQADMGDESNYFHQPQLCT